MIFDEALSKVALMVYEELDTPRSLTCALLLRHREYVQLANLSTDPRDYIDSRIGVTQYRRDTVATAFLRKNASLPTQIDLAGSAFLKWIAAERQCYETNRKLNHLVDQDLRLWDDPLARLLVQVRKEMVSLLGRAPSIEKLNGEHGPGATVSHKGQRTISIIKYYDPPSVSDSLPDQFIDQIGDTLWGTTLFSRYGNSVDIPSYDGNEWASVPKDCLTDRSIGIEPTLNIWYQKAIGTVMKRRLARSGLLDAPPRSSLVPELSFSVRNAQLRHRNLARLGSVSGEIATIDLSNASDTVAYNLVKLCLPSDWFYLLDSTRCTKTVVRGMPYLLEKFSSMGNGFTFELETALFYAIIKAMAACCGYRLRTLSVFGDDIIVDTEFADRAILALKGMGFSTNSSKTFSQPLPFRESCGGDFFLGEDVRPYFCKDVPSSPMDWIALHNGLWRLNLFSTRVEKQVLANLPVKFRELKGPSDLGDIVLHSEDEHTWRSQYRASIRYVKAVIPQFHQYSRERFDENCVLLASLRGQTSEKVSYRGSALLGFKERWVPYS